MYLDFAFNITPVDAMNFVVVSYILAFLCVCIVELVPRRRLARAAALSSIALSLAGGAAWAYAAHFERAVWPVLVEYQPAAAADDAGKPIRYVGRPGKEIDPEAMVDASASGNPSSTSSSASSANTRGNGAVA